MKIVINSCYGGFSLSYEAVMRYAELEGIKLYPFVSCDNGKYRPYVKGEDYFTIHYATEPLNPDGIFVEGSYWNEDFERNDLLLIQVIEELGQKANGKCANLKIVEIPDNVKWEIDEYDGSESVHEIHRSWD